MTAAPEVATRPREVPGHLVRRDLDALVDLLAGGEVAVLCGAGMSTD